MYLDIEVCKMSELRRKDKITVEMKMRPAFCATLASASLARLLICCFCFCACVPDSNTVLVGVAADFYCAGGGTNWIRSNDL